MDRYALSEELRNIFQEFLGAKDLDLVELIYRYEGRDLFLRILVDKPEGGITLGECANLNKEISMILDEKDILQQRYILEVSSPGLDRPLRTKNDFLRCMKRPVKFFLKEPIHGQWEREGVITKVGDDSVSIDTDDEVVEIPLSRVAKARQIISNS